MCMAEDAEGYFVRQTEAIRRARKPWKCGECSREIAPGETYEFFSGLLKNYDTSDGYMTFRTCAHCIAAREWIVQECGRWLYDAVGEDLREHWDIGGAYRNLWLGRALVGMRRQWRRRDGELLPVLGPPPEIDYDLAAVA